MSGFDLCAASEFPVLEFVAFSSIFLNLDCKPSQSRVVCLVTPDIEHCPSTVQRPCCCFVGMPENATLTNGLKVSSAWPTTFFVYERDFASTRVIARRGVAWTALQSEARTPSNLFTHRRSLLRSIGGNGWFRTASVNPRMLALYDQRANWLRRSASLASSSRFSRSSRSIRSKADWRAADTRGALAAVGLFLWASYEILMRSWL